MSKQSIAEFLHYGYLPSCRSNCGPVLAHLSHRARNSGEGRSNQRSLAEKGVATWSHVVEDILRNAGAKRSHLVPLSGGLDSRAILGGLLKHLDRRNITAVTFGTPGTWDFDIGRLVARTVGCEWVGVDLTSSNWSWDLEGLVATAKESATPNWVFDAFVNRRVREQFSDDAACWSGFMGDPLSGSHLPGRPSLTWGEACQRFAARNCFCDYPSQSSYERSPLVSLPTEPLVPREELTYDEQLDFEVRQECFIRDVVIPAGYDYCVPFLHESWISFSLSVPDQLRRSQLLYKDMLQLAAPHLFSLPTKTYYGLPLTAASRRVALRASRLRIMSRMARCLGRQVPMLNPAINYVDFDRALRSRPDLQGTVEECIGGLKARGVVHEADVNSLWQRHLHPRHNGDDNARFLTLLAALEINLRAGKLAE